MLHFNVLTVTCMALVLPARVDFDKRELYTLLA